MWESSKQMMLAVVGLCQRLLKWGPQQHGWTQMVIIPSEVSQKEKDKYCMISHICRI